MQHKAVVDVLEHSPAGKAGVCKGDVVLGYNGKVMAPGSGGNALRMELSLMSEGDSLMLVLYRGSKILHLAVRT